jgi:hypothetical protein
MSVGFSLPDARPARIELIDVSGRLVESNEVGRLGAGRHTVTIGKGSELGPGVYLLRLVREDEKLTARAVVLR